MFLQILFFLIVLVMLFMSFLYLKRQTHVTFEIRYTVISRLVVVVLLAVIFIENIHQSEILNSINNDISAYITDAGKTLMAFIDDKTMEISRNLKEISDNIGTIQVKMDGIDAANKSISTQIGDLKNTITYQFNSQMTSLAESLIEKLTGVNPGGIVTIW